MDSKNGQVTSHSDSSKASTLPVGREKGCELRDKVVFVVEERKHQSYSDEGVITDYAVFGNRDDAEAYQRMMTDDDIFTYVIRDMAIR